MKQRQLPASEAPSPPSGSNFVRLSGSLPTKIRRQHQRRGVAGVAMEQGALDRRRFRSSEEFQGYHFWTASILIGKPLLGCGFSSTTILQAPFTFRIALRSRRLPVTPHSFDLLRGQHDEADRYAYRLCP